MFIVLIFSRLLVLPGALALWDFLTFLTLTILTFRLQEDVRQQIAALLQDSCPSSPRKLPSQWCALSRNQLKALTLSGRIHKVFSRYCVHVCADENRKHLSMTNELKKTLRGNLSRMVTAHGTTLFCCLCKVLKQIFRFFKPNSWQPQQYWFLMFFAWGRWAYWRWQLRSYPAYPSFEAGSS